ESFVLGRKAAREKPPDHARALRQASGKYSVSKSFGFARGFVRQARMQKPRRSHYRPSGAEPGFACPVRIPSPRPVSHGVKPAPSARAIREPAMPPGHAALRTDTGALRPSP